MRIVVISLALIFLIVGCVSAPAQLPTKLMPTSLEVLEVATPTLNGISIHLTERVATIIALQTASSTPFPTGLATQTSTLAATSTATTLNLFDLTNIAAATQNPILDKYCNPSSHAYFFNHKWGVCDRENKSFAVFNISGDIWRFSYVKLGIALADEGSEYYTQTIYATQDGAFAYFAPFPQGYDSLGTSYGNGVALLRVDLRNGQIQTILPHSNNFYSISFSPTGRRIVYALLNKPLDLIIQDLQSGELKHIELEEKYTQAGQFVWSNDELSFAYKLIIDGDECSRKYAIRLLNIDKMSSTAVIQDTQGNNCQQLDTTYFVTNVTNKVVMLEQHGDVWVYNIPAQRLVLQATATPRP